MHHENRSCAVAGAASDAALVALVGKGDTDAFEQLHARHRGFATAVARRSLGSDAAVDDVVQEAFLSVWQRSGQFDLRRGNVRNWLAGIVRNRATDALRHEQSQQRRRLLAEQEAGRGAEPDTVVGDIERAQDARVLRAAVERLPRDQYRVIDLGYYVELRQPAIAEILDAPLGTIKSRNRLALAKLRSALRDVAGSGPGPLAEG